MPEFSTFEHDLSSIKAIWIDVDQTLLDFDACAKVALQTTFDRYGLEWSDDVFDTFLKENSLLWDQIEEGKLTRAELRKIRFPIIFKALDRKLPDPEHFESIFSTILHQQAIAMPDANDSLVYLKQAGLHLAVISNGPDQGQKNRLTIAGMMEYFDAIYTSEKLGSAKPSRDFFDKALEEFQNVIHEDLDPEQILVIGDSWKADIQGAIDSGFQSLWLSANRKLDPFDPHRHPMVIEVNSWKEIQSLLLKDRA